MNISKAVYIMYFWHYATVEQIEDMVILPVDIIAEYILEIGKNYYNKYRIAKTDEKTIIKVA